MPQNRINISVLRLADSDIECVDSFNFVGITIIDKHVNWVAYTNTVARRIYRTTGVLNRLKHILPMYILKSIYTALIMCHLNYGILVQGHMPLIKIGQWYIIEIPLKIPFNTIQRYLLVIRPTVF